MVQITEKLLKDVEKAKKRNKKERAASKKKAPKASAKKPTEVTAKRCVPDTKDFNQNTEIIRDLHTEMKFALCSALEKALAMGDLLFRQKEVIERGFFGDWVDKTLPFKIRTAQRYMKLAQYKKALAKAGVVSITDAYLHIYGEPVSEVIIEADDSTKTSYVTVTETVNIENMNLPKVAKKGLMTKMTLNHDNIDKMISGKYFIGDNKELRESYSKIVIELKSNANCNDRIGEFVVAVEKYLMLGGKIIFKKV